MRLSKAELLLIAEAVAAWANHRQMNPILGTYWIEKNGQITIRLKEQYNGDPLVPNVDYLIWKPSHPCSITGYQYETWNGKVTSRVRGGWVDFICPVKLTGVYQHV